MPLRKEEKDLFLLHKGKPIVGLIHKNKRDIVFAACVPQKVSIDLNEKGEAKSGYVVADALSISSDLTEVQLEELNALLKQNHVPRLAYPHGSFYEAKSAHEFLFEQKCQTTKRSEWGGFCITLDDSGKLNYSFASGAFNSEPGQRTKGAELSEELIIEVKNQIANLVNELNLTVLPTSPIKESSSSLSLLALTPEKKRALVDLRVTPLNKAPKRHSTHSLFPSKRDHAQRNFEFNTKLNALASLPATPDENSFRLK